MKDYNQTLQQDLDNVQVWQGACGGYYRGNGGYIVIQWPHTMDKYDRRLATDTGSFVEKTYQ